MGPTIKCYFSFNFSLTSDECISKTSKDGKYYTVSKKGICVLKTNIYLNTSNLAQNSCSITVLKSAGAQVSNTPHEI